jgi:hypothetical protein
MPISCIAPKTLNYLAFQSFDFERTWWRLFQKRDVRTKFDIYVFFFIDYVKVLFDTINSLLFDTIYRLLFDAIYRLLFDAIHRLRSSKLWQLGMEV